MWVMVYPRPQNDRVIGDFFKIFFNGGLIFLKKLCDWR